MRNLKRALSLGLTAAMISGLMVMGSSAASYADVTSEDNQEAIEVLQAVEIMVGDENGDFNPDQNVTRNEMAVIMANLMEYNVASYKNTSPFTDVPAWAEPYVAACWTNGITAGYSDTIYGGSDTVTTAQAALMLMKALGYFQYASDFGSDWQLATTRQGNDIDLFVGVDSGVTQAMTRNDVAQLVLNTLQSGTVEAETDGSLQIGDITISKDVKYTYVTSNQTYATAISRDKSTSGTTDAGRSIVELGEKLYNGDLKLDEGTTDVFGRPARTWSYEGDEIGTFAQKELMVAEYTTAVTGKELYDAVGKTAYDKYDFYSYVNGEESDLYKEISRNNKDDVKEIDDGALTQVFVDTDDETATVTVINTYLAKASSDYNEKRDEVTFTVYGLNNSTKPVTVSGEDFAIEDVAEDDFVLVTYADKEIQSISDVDILSDVEIKTFSTSGGKVTAVNVDGTKYNDSATLYYDDEVLDDYTENNLKDTTYNVYLDQYGYVIGVDIVDAAKNYVFITGVDANSSNLTTKNFEANALFLDGTSDVIDVKNNGVLDADGGAVINTWYTYTKSSSGVYTLKAIDYGTISEKNDIGQYHHNATRTSGSELDDNVIDYRHISLKGADSGVYSKVYGTDDTVYLLAELDKVTTSNTDYAVVKAVDEVVTGIDNASFELYTRADARDEVNATNGIADDTTTSSGAYPLYDDNGDIIAAVVVGESDSVSESIAYMISDNLEDESYDKSTEEWTWTRKAIINGEEVLLTEVGDDDNSVLENYDADKDGRWVTVKYDADGNVKKLEARDVVTTLENAVKAIEDDEDTVVVAIDGVTNDYTLKGKTLFDQTTKKEGFRVDENVNIALNQTTKNKNTTEYYTGVTELKNILDELNGASKNHNYDFNAVIEDGKAVAVVIIDNLGDGSDQSGPSGSTSEGVANLSGSNNAGDPGAKIELTQKATKDTTYYVDLQMMNNDGDWNHVDTIAVVVKAGTNYGFTPINSISANQQYRLVCGELTALLSLGK